MASEIKLTQYSHGAGCGCKLSPAVLDKILHTEEIKKSFPALLVGYESKDDAAVYEWKDGQCIISTTDFFMPIVDDAYDFGAIASVNAISDIYAMGGSPMMAIAILGWPIDKLPPDVASNMLNGARAVCNQAGIPLAGGHSIDCPEPIFGLAVTGQIAKQHIKQNSTAKKDSLLYLTKSLGVGLITTAQKKGMVQDAHMQAAIQSMKTLNKIGEAFGQLSYVEAMTDVTGFGLLGHLIEMCEGSNLSAEIVFEKIPAFPFVQTYIEQKSIPGGTVRNLKSYGEKVFGFSPDELSLLADPQTSGGLLVCVNKNYASDFEAICKTQHLTCAPFGHFISPQTHRVVKGK